MVLSYKENVFEKLLHKNSGYLRTRRSQISQKSTKNYQLLHQNNFFPLHSPLFSQRTNRKVIKAHHIPVAAKAPQSLRTLTIRRQCCHHNTCIHYFFVSQGLGDVPMSVNITYPITTVYGDNSTSHTCYWMNRNMKYTGVPCENPLMEGGKFRWGNASQALKPEDDFMPGYGFNIECYSTGKTHLQYIGDNVSFTGIWHPERPTGFRYDEHATYKGRFYNDRWPAKYADWTALQSFPRYYGVLYGEESTETATNTTDAYTYINPGDVKGMQGLFVWDRVNGRHLFFPIGATGYGHRKGSDLYKKDWGGDGNVKRDVLKYAQRSLEMPTATAQTIPMLYDLWMRKGAIYWYEENEFYTINKECFAHDINYYTYDLNTYGANPVTMADKGATDPHTNVACRSAQWADACYVRCVHY